VKGVWVWNILNRTKIWYDRVEKQVCSSWRLCAYWRYRLSGLVGWSRPVSWARNFAVPALSPFPSPDILSAWIKESRSRCHSTKVFVRKTNFLHDFPSLWYLAGSWPTHPRRRQKSADTQCPLL